MSDKLFAEARVMSVNKNLNDVTTLLLWAHDASDPADKLAHIERAISLLGDVRDTLADEVVPEEVATVAEDDAADEPDHVR